MKKIAVVIELQWPVNRHYQVYAGIQSYAATKRDWELAPDVFPEAVLSGMWPGRRYDAVIGRINPSTLKAAKKAGIPVVNTWLNSPCAAETGNVYVDVAASAEIAISHFVDRGLRHVAHVGVTDDRSTQVQLAAARTAAKAHGITLSHHLSDLRRYVETESIQKFNAKVSTWAQEWHDANRMPIGILTPYDLTARELAVMLKRSGWNVPNDVAIVGTGNSDLLCTSCEPSLSRVSKVTGHSPSEWFTSHLAPHRVRIASSAPTDSRSSRMAHGRTNWSCVSRLMTRVPWNLHFPSHRTLTSASLNSKPTRLARPSLGSLTRVP